MPRKKLLAQMDKVIFKHSDIEMLIKIMLTEALFERLTFAAHGIRMLLVLTDPHMQRNHLISDIIENGLVPELIEFCKKDGFPTL